MNPSNTRESTSWKLPSSAPSPTTGSFSTRPTRREGHQLQYFDVPLGRRHGRARRGLRRRLHLRQRHRRTPTCSKRCTRGGTRLVALRCTGLQQRRSGGRGTPRHQGRARRRLFAELGGGARRRAAARDQPQDAPRLQPHARFQLLARRPDGLRPVRQDGRRRRHGQDRPRLREDHAGLRLQRDRLRPVPVARNSRRWARAMRRPAKSARARTSSRCTAR